MKRRPKKLALNRETLSGLEQSLEQELQQVAGGATLTCMAPHSHCEYSGAGRRTCLTCQLTCTTNYC